MKNSDNIRHVRGESLFLDDFPVPEGTLYAAVYASPIAHGRMKRIDITRAMQVSGVRAILTAKDIPGQNQIGSIISDETLLAEDQVQYIGEPLAVVVADDQETARRACRLIELKADALPVVTDPREAYRQGHLLAPPVVFSMGDTESAWANCNLIVEDRVDIGGQEHLYLETQGALAWPTEGDGLKIISSTQGPTAVQRNIARVLNLPMHRVEVDVLRLGGAFGGKEDQATSWAVMAALAAHHLKQPVKLILSRKEDLYMTGKRHPYSADYKIGLDAGGKILAYQVTFYQNGGAYADLSTAILERTLFHATNSYYIPNVRATGISCRTNLPPNTAFRGFGGPQGMFVIEAAIHKAARALGWPAYRLQQKNLLEEGDLLYYGQKTEACHLKRCWDEAIDRYELSRREEEVHKFNSTHRLLKKGLAMMPITFGISFTNSLLNQASALIHVYTDGSIGISTAAIEMGQGVNQKIRTVVARLFSVDIDRVKMETTNTTRIANTSATAASTGADLNGNAALIAGQTILNRLRLHAAALLGIKDTKKIDIRDERVCIDGQPGDLYWPELIQSAYVNRISLSAQAYYATPGIYFNRRENKGKPFAYHVYGTAIIEATLDCLRGTYAIDSVQIVHDFGQSLDPLVDRGQVEGAVVQGIGWLTLEELVQDSQGRLLSNTFSTYKVPDIYSAPGEIRLTFLSGVDNPLGPFNSKAIGEPPLMYGIGAYFAILNAMREFSPELNFNYRAPLTPERVLLSLYQTKLMET